MDENRLNEIANIIVERVTSFRNPLNVKSALELLEENPLEVLKRQMRLAHA